MQVLRYHDALCPLRLRNDSKPNMVMLTMMSTATKGVCRNRSVLLFFWHWRPMPRDRERANRIHLIIILIEFVVVVIVNVVRFVGAEAQRRFIIERTRLDVDTLLLLLMIITTVGRTDRVVWQCIQRVFVCCVHALSGHRTRTDCHRRRSQNTFSQHTNATNGFVNTNRSVFAVLWCLLNVRIIEKCCREMHISYSPIVMSIMLFSCLMSYLIIRFFENE